MYVVATAGHVDHGKSTLVRALTGMEPDRWAEERRRGMTIDLGYAWTTLPSGGTVAFVDVPGHERFVGNMLAGVGPVPAVLLVVAADEGWMPQSAEHLDALDALGVQHGLLAVTRADLADPAPAMESARAHIARTSLGQVEAVAVSGETGTGLDQLRAALDRLVAALPPPDLTAPVRLWIDRAFTVRGAGTVVTGTLAAGSVRTGDPLLIAPGGRTVTVRGLQSLGRPVDAMDATARIAVNLRGVHPDEVRRGTTLLTPDAWLLTDLVDVRLRGDPADDLPSEMSLHVGSAAAPVRVRPLGADTVRLSLAEPLPLRIGDRAVLRDPGRRRVAAGVLVLDVRPPALSRRGAARARAGVLARADGVPDGAAELRRRRLIRVPELRAMGAEPPGAPVAGDWLADPDHWAQLRVQLNAAVADHAAAHPLDPGLPVEAARHLLDLPDGRLVPALVARPITLRDGRLWVAGPPLPAELTAALDEVRRDLADAPFAAPESRRLADLGLGSRQLAAAVRAGELLKVTDGVYLLPGADARAAQVVGGLPQPFTTSEARRALATSRRVAVPLLELLDRRGRTQRLPDDRRRVVDAAP
jgi:selenocysteine-specific elongation factor